MAIDILDGNPDTYDLNTAEDKLRKLVLNEMGGTWDYYTFQDNKYKVFAILSEILTESTSRVLREVFEPFCEFRDFELGDTVEFTVEDDRLFEVSVVATDNNNLLRQKLMNRKVPMTASELGVKIYAPFTAWLAGRIDLAKLVDRVQKSTQQDMVRRIGNAFVSAYGQCHANLVESGTVTRDALSLLCAKVDGLGLGDPVIYGTKTAFTTPICTLLVNRYSISLSFLAPDLSSSTNAFPSKPTIIGLVIPLGTMYRCSSSPKPNLPVSLLNVFFNSTHFIPSNIFK